jgi:hypothetical protein
MQNFSLTTQKINEFVDFLNDTNGKNYMDVVRDLIKFDPFDGHPFYIFSIIKLQDKNRLHQPRLTKPEPVPGGTLLRVDPKHPETMKLCWTLPPHESFNLYKYEKALADRFVWECIQTYKKNPKQFMEPEEGDVSDEIARELYLGLKKRIARLQKEENRAGATNSSS